LTRDLETARRGCGSADTILAAFGAYADELSPALFGHWRTE